MKHLKLESLGEVEQSLVQIFNAGSHPAVTVCLGTGVESRQSAARSEYFSFFTRLLQISFYRCALIYIKTMAKTDEDQQ